MSGPMAGDPLQWAEGALRRYWSEDGLTDVVVGLFLVAYGWLFEQGQQHDAAWAKVLLVALVLVVALRMRAVIHALKMRWVYPRAGYARPRALPRETRLKRSVWVLAAALLVVGLLIALDLPARVVCGLTGALMTFLWAWIGWRNGTARHFFLAAVSGGWVLWHLLQPGVVCDLVALFILTGLLEIALGLFAFGRFLRKYPQAQGGAP